MADLIPTTVFDLSWSFEPIFRWFRIFGIDLNTSEVQLLPRRCGFILLQIAVTGATVTNFALLEIIEAGVKEPNLAETVYLFHDYTYIFLFPSILLATIYASHFNWNSLWKSIREMEQALDLNEGLYRRLRKISLASVFLMIMVIISSNVMALYFSTNVTDVFLQVTVAIVGSKLIMFTRQTHDGTAAGLHRDAEFLVKLMELIYLMYFPFSMGPLFLFCIFCWLASTCLQVAISSIPPEYLSQQAVLSQIHLIMKWKKNYGLICDYVEQINHFFGYNLVAATLMLFVDVVLFTFCAIRLSDYEPILIELGFSALWHLILVTSTVLTANKIKQQVRYQVIWLKFTRRSPASFEFRLGYSGKR